MKEALFYETIKEKKTRCTLCIHKCILRPGEVGLCLGRKNIGGKLYAVNYGWTTSLCVDPIEKKPLYHFHPGIEILSIAPNGCNLKCPFCQNAEISQKEIHTSEITPRDVVSLCKKYDSIGVAYTYSEPLIWYEFLLDTGKLVKKAGLKNVLVTNGIIEEEPLKQLLPLIDAFNIDLKSIRETFYRKVVKGDLFTVQRTITMAHKSSHVELTNLLITDLNDSDEDIIDLIDWVYNLDPTIPLHFSRYFPHYKLDNPPTPQERLEFAYRKAKEKLDYVYVGNIHIKDSNNTYCPRCKNLLIERRGYHGARICGLNGTNCSNCGKSITIIL
ncbi:MAG: AmmeMemoRadiSam system radical SAM enzyme [Candidatus Cloacimonadota bacterium]|nr:MAG: AmmeMemoRadiSam system radical SAM enzyme [Candidatus Cloacimonadota bacterium]